MCLSILRGWRLRVNVKRNVKHVNPLIPQIFMVEFFWENMSQLKAVLNTFFPLILRIIDLECGGHTSLKVAFVLCRLVFMKFRKLKKPPTRKQET